MTTTSQVTTKDLSTLPDMGEWVRAAELEVLLSVSRQRVQQIVNRADFPAPDIVLKMGKVWRTERVREWARERDRELFE